MMNTFFISICFFNILILLHAHENILNTTMLKRYAFVNAPKEWFRYITKYLQMTLGKRYSNLKEQYISMKINTLQRDTSLKSNVENIMMYPKGLTIRTREMSDNQEDKIMFVLDRNLHLNLTFHHIHFGFRNLHDCSVGQLAVISHSTERQVYRYCGIYSNLINYPQNRNVSITSTVFAGLRIKDTHIYNVSIFYSVIDKKMIISLPKYKSFRRNFVWNLYLEQNSIRVMKFNLVTKKYQVFLINFTVDSDVTVELFDGPGTRSSNIFMYNQESHTSSTFQCVIHLWIPSSKNLNAEYGYKFVVMSNTVSKIIRINDSFPFKTSHVPAEPEIWKMVSHSNVNLTIENLTYKNYNDPECSFAGIAVYNLNNDTYTEVGTECFSPSDLGKYRHMYSYSREIPTESVIFDHLFAHRNIYSNSNDTLLVLYSYRQYGNLSITIQLSTTECRPVTINTCALSYLCKIPNNEMCKRHKEEIKSLNFKHSQISTDFPVSVYPGQCFIFQMFAVIDRLTRSKAFTDCILIFITLTF